MTDNKTIEPYASMLAKAQARQDLRHDLSRWLAHPPALWRTADLPDIDALSLLDLCVHYRVVFAGADPNLKTAWAGAQAPKGGPSFDELIDQGWLVFDGCRWMFPPLPIRTSSSVSYPDDRTRVFLNSLGGTSLQPAQRGLSSAADALAKEFMARTRDLDSLAWRPDADWIAARLWERLCPPSDADDNAVDAAFQDWCTWGLVLRAGGKWDLNWDTAQSQHCRNASWRVLGRQTQWGEWGQDSERYVEVLTKTFGIPAADVPHPSPEDAGTLVERVQSLRDPAMQHLNEARLRPTAAGFALNVLCSELERTDISAVVLNSATKLLGFVASHPIAFNEWEMRLSSRPKLLADMLMQPTTAATASMLIGEWIPSTNAWNRVQSSTREEVVKRFAVQDALGVLAYLLKTDPRELQELAALVTWCYSEALGIRNAANAEVQRAMGQQLLATVAAQPPGIQVEFLDHLVPQARMQRNVRFAVFGGVLDALASLPAASPGAAAPLIALYTEFARGDELDRTDVARLSTTAVAQLVNLAFQQPQGQRDAFLYPLDIRARLKAAKDEDRMSVEIAVARVLRTHIRMLARAVAGWKGGPIPDPLADALLKLVWHACIDHAKKARVAALTPRFSAIRLFSSDIGSPAEDIAAAWRQLDARRQTDLLHTLKDSDDPVLLADLCRSLPSTAGAVMRTSLAALTPANAAQPVTWLELEQRAAALVDAGELGQAETFLKEATTDDDKAPEGIRLKTFGLGLKLLIKKKAWADIDAAAVPASFSELLKPLAEEFLLFYRATSHVLRPDGNLTAAKQALAGLANRPNAPVAYRENYFAAAIRVLIGPTLRTLSEEDKEEGARLLSEIDVDIADMGSDVARTQVLVENRAQLLITLDRPQEAIDALAPFRTGRGTKETEVLAALARSAMGLSDQAADILDAAIGEFGDDPELLDAKRGLHDRTPAAITPSPSLEVDELKDLRLAMYSLLTLQPDQVGDLLGPAKQGLRGYLTDLVSRALAGLQHLAPVLRDRGNPLVYLQMEDDLNTAVREILDAYLKIVRWTAKDQSFGGRTKAGNLGERDIVICSGNQELSLYEAMVCDGVDRGNIQSHFHKLLAYGTVDIHFHVIYSFATDINPLLGCVEEIAQKELPPHTVFETLQRLGPPNLETRGFLANYKFDSRDVAVVFFIADLGQGALQLAHQATKAVTAKSKPTVPAATKAASSRAKKAP